MRIARTIGLNVERKMKEEIERDPEHINTFIRFRCPQTQSSNELRLLQHKRHNIEVEATTRNESIHIQIDYVFGDFLVDGSPMGRLPEEITQHPIFIVFSATLPLKCSERSERS